MFISMYTVKIQVKFVQIAYGFFKTIIRISLRMEEELDINQL